MSLVLLFGGGAPSGPLSIHVDPADLTWAGQTINIIGSGGALTISVLPADLTWVGQSLALASAPGSIGALMAFLPIKYATAVTIPFDLIKRGAVDFAGAADYTPATGDVKVSQDGSAFTNVATLPSVTSGTDWAQPLTTGETTGKFISVKLVDSTVKAVEDQALKCFTYGHPSAYWPFDLSNALSSQAVGSVTGAVGSVTGTIGGFVDPPGLKRSSALANWTFEMRDATTGLLKTGLTVTARRRIDGGAWAACTNSPSETSEAGMYTIDLASTDTNGTWIVYKFTATGAIETIRYVLTEP